MSNFWISFIYIFYMAGMGMCVGSVMTNALKVVGKQDATQGNAIMNTLQQFAGAMGTSLTAAIVATSQKHLAGSLALTTAVGTQHAFILLTIFAAITLVSYYRYVR